MVLTASALGPGSLGAGSSLPDSLEVLAASFFEGGAGLLGIEPRGSRVQSWYDRIL